MHFGFQRKETCLNPNFTYSNRLMQQLVTFPSGKVIYITGLVGEEFILSRDAEHTVLVTDEHIAGLYPHFFRKHRTLVVRPTEADKSMETIMRLSYELLRMGATRKTILVGVGGGIVSDITGFLAAIYMRGIAFGFVPTTLLGMVDAAIGGKNGVNLGLNKNILGTIRQPSFIFYDTQFLKTLPDEEWSNGFAEIIKYACIFDAEMYGALKKNNISFYKQDAEALSALIEKCVAWKNKTVIEDERETGIRKLLNFGHTAGHAIENLYDLSHGKAVGIGMVIACMVSCNAVQLDAKAVTELKELLTQYHLPVKIKLDTASVMELLRMDKKRNDDDVDYIVLEKIGEGAIKTLPFAEIEKVLSEYESES